MKIRAYKKADCESLSRLFYATVHTINAKDYTKQHLDVWANDQIDLKKWHQSFLRNTCLVAEIDNIIVGFGDINSSGYLDRLFVHKDYQGQKIASTLLVELELKAKAKNISLITTHASITAKPFFEKHGYISIIENTVMRDKIALTNFIMQKPI